MSRYHPVRPKASKAKSQRREAPSHKTSSEETLVKTIRDAADALYLERDGASIDKAIKRAERTLELFDRELERVGAPDAEKPKWLISPSVALRWQRELERQQERRETLRSECLVIARRLVEDWMQGSGEQPPSPGVSDFQESAEVPSKMSAEVPKGGADADAVSEAA